MRATPPRMTTPSRPFGRGSPTLADRVVCSQVFDHLRGRHNFFEVDRGWRGGADPRLAAPTCAPRRAENPDSPSGEPRLTVRRIPTHRAEMLDSPRVVQSARACWCTCA